MLTMFVKRILLGLGQSLRELSETHRPHCSYQHYRRLGSNWYCFSLMFRKVVCSQTELSPQWCLWRCQVTIYFSPILFIVVIFSYMPVFLWKEKMRRGKKDAFKELLKMVASRQNEDHDEVDSASFGEVYLIWMSANM